MTTSLADIKAALAAATPGPWRAAPNYAGGGWEGGGYVEAATVSIADVKARGGVPHPVGDSCRANAALIAAAPAWLAELVERLELAEASEAEAWAKRRLYFSERNDEMKARVASLEAEAARLREALRDIKSYLGAAGQDAKDEWVGKRIASALGAES